MRIGCSSPGASNGHYTDSMTLPISDWLFNLEDGTIPPYCALQFLPFISIGVNRLCISIVFGNPQFSVFSMKKKNSHILDGLRVKKLSANFHFCVN